MIISFPVIMMQCNLKLLLHTVLAYKLMGIVFYLVDYSDTCIVLYSDLLNKQFGTIVMMAIYTIVCYYREVALFISKFNM